MRVKRFSRSAAGMVAVLFCAGFKPSTHMHSGNLASSSPQFVLGDRSYSKDPAVFAAIAAYPDYYRGGVVGPDGFPDLLFGQSIIHPDLRCENQSGLDYAACSDASGHGFTYEWLAWVHDRGMDRYAELINGSADDKVEAQQVLAFTIGYLTHAAGDMWAHTMVNHYAGGVFPAAAEMVTTSDARNIGIRHIVVEGFIGLRTPTSSSRDLEAPLGFVRSTFIRDREPSSIDPCSGANDIAVPTPLAKGSHFDSYLKTRNELCDYHDEHAGMDFGDAVVCGLTFGGGCLAQAIEEAAVTYARYWAADIDEGLRKWPKFSEDVARALFTNESFGDATGIVEEFALGHMASMAGLPDVVGDGILLIGEATDALTALLSRIPGLQFLKDKLHALKVGILNQLFNRFFGVSYEQARSYLTEPAMWIDSATIGLGHSPVDPARSTSADLTDLMHVEGGTYSISEFAAFRNATVTAELLLMKPETLDEMLYDLHVGKLYTSSTLQAKVDADPSTPTSLEIDSVGRDMKRNALRGFARSIDANHAWQHSATDYRSGDTARYGEGMPLWRDCLARSRVFPHLFKDDRALELGEADDGCSYLAEPLPAIELIPVGEPSNTGPRQMAPLCGVGQRFKIVNRLDQARPYSFYYQVLRGPERERVYHSVVQRTGDEAVPARGTTEELAGFSTCEAGSYTIEVFLFQEMRQLPAEGALNIRFKPPLSPYRDKYYFSSPIVDQYTFTSTLDDPANCKMLRPCPTRTPVGPGTALCEYPICPAPGSVVRPALDADGDEVIDDNDNCAVHPNADQADRDRDRAGDACDRGTLGRVPRFERCDWDPACLDRLREALRRLTRDDFPPPRGGNPCLSCPPDFGNMAPYLQHELELFDRGLLPAGELLQRVWAIQDGPHLTGPTVRVTSAKFDAERHQVTYSLGDTSSGKVDLLLPRSVVAYKRRGGAIEVAIRIDGRSTPVKAHLLGGQLRARFTLPKGARSITVGLEVPR